MRKVNKDFMRAQCNSRSNKKSNNTDKDDGMDKKERKENC